MFRFTLPRDIYVGHGAIEQLSVLEGHKKAFICTGGHSMRRGGFLQKTEEALHKAGIETYTMEGIDPDPSIEKVREGAKAMEEFGPDVIIAIGGGSPIDAAKAMWVFYEYPELTFEEVQKPFSLPTLRQKAIFVAIPSTSGTASEVTSFAVITDYSTGIKYPLADFNLTPDLAILDLDLPQTMPKKLCAHTGMDALTHATEAYVSKFANGFTDPLAKQAVSDTFDSIIDSYNEDTDARDKMHIAQCMAGMAFANAFLGVNHSLAHKLGAFHHLPHGIANALVLLHVLRYNAAEVPAKMGTFPQYQYPHTLARYAEIGRSVGLTGKNDSEVFEKLLQKLQELMDTIEIKHTIKEYGVDEKYFLETLDEMTEQAFNDQCTGANPRYPLMSELKEIYLKAYYGEGNVPESRKAKEKKETK